MLVPDRVEVVEDLGQVVVAGPFVGEPAARAVDEDRVRAHALRYDQAAELPAIVLLAGDGC